MSAFSVGSFTNLWKVFVLFSIPVGGGIPTGVLFAKSQGLGWATVSVLYLMSDIVLALYFEPLMILFIRISKKNQFMTKFLEAIKKSTQKTIAGFGAKPGPFMLVVIAFGVDPMTGRAAAQAAGHGFLAGWTIAIIGDMFFFAIVMASTLWLNNILGDGILAALIVMFAMMIIPSTIRRIREWKRR